MDAPRLDDDDGDDDDETKDDKVISIIDNYRSCSIPNEKAHPKLGSLLKEVQTHDYNTTCRKKKGVTCRFSAPWPPSERTLIVLGGKKIDNHLQTGKKVLDRVLLQTIQIGNSQDITLSKVLESCNVTEDQFYEAELNIGPHNIVLLPLLQANLSIQYVIVMYARLIYLTSFLFKPEHAMSELIKKAAKETTRKEVMQILLAIGNLSWTKRKDLSHEKSSERIIFTHA